jgi:hypothetical protein
MPSMLTRHEASLLLCLDKLPVMDISKQLQSITRDEKVSVALPSLFENNQAQDPITRYDKRYMILASTKISGTS